MMFRQFTTSITFGLYMLMLNFLEKKGEALFIGCNLLVVAVCEVILVF